MLFVSFLMLAVPLIPHHHHADGAICLKNDIGHSTDCDHHHAACTHSHHQPDNDACCNDDCLTRFYTSTPTAQVDLGHPHHVFVAVLFTDYLIENILTPDAQRIKNYYVYRESLHGTHILSAFALRGPPALFA